MGIIGNVTTTEGLQCTQMLIPGFHMLNEHSNEAQDILLKELTGEEQQDCNRFYCLAVDKQGKKYGCTGTTDIELYVEIED